MADATLEQHPPRRSGLRIRLMKHAHQELLQKKPRVSSAEASRSYRARLKQDPEHYKAFREYENARVKAYVIGISEDKKAQYREKTRLRVQKHRQKMRAEGKLPKPTAGKTRSEKDKQRKEWRHQKAEQHGKETKEQRDQRNAKRRKRYAELHQPHKGQNKLDNPQPEIDQNGPSTPGDQGYSNPETLRKAAYRAKKSLPKDRSKCVDVIEKIISSATPKKKKMLAEKLIVSPNSKKRLDFANEVISSFANSMNSLKKARSRKALQKKRSLVCSLGSSILKKYSIKHGRVIGIGYKLLKKAKEVKSEEDLEKRQKRKDAVSDVTMKVIHEFYRRGDVSRSLPDARGVKRQRNGDLMSRSVMEHSTTSAFQLFKEEHPDVKISRSMFASLRPEDVLPTTSSRRRDCLCEYCANIDLKLEALRLFGNRNQLDISIQDKFVLSRMTLCPKGINGEYQRACLERTCIECGPSALERHLRPLLEAHITSDVQYLKWVNVQRDGKTRMTRKKHVASGADFVAELVSEVKTFSKHLFDASWQGRQYDLISRTVPEGSVVICQDFAENFKCRFQDEAQGAHWSYTQVTLHASVASYRCDVDPACDATVTHSFIHVSPDAKHDSHAVHAFNGTAISTLQDRPDPFKKIVFFSDGAPTQYKNKTAFAYLSCADKDFGVEAERHFFGSRHGKGPCDREFGTLKKAVNLAVSTRRAELDSAKDFFLFCKEKYTRGKDLTIVGHSHYRRDFFYVEDILRECERFNNLKPLDKTRQQHCVKSVRPHVVSFRERSCFCTECLGGGSACPNSDITGVWKIMDLQKGRPNDMLITTPGYANWTLEVSSTYPEASPVLQFEFVKKVSSVDNHSPNSSTHLPEIRLKPADRMTDSAQKLLDHSPQEATSSDNPRVPCGCWVEVKFTTRGRALAFRGQVIDYDAAKKEAQIKYLKCKGAYYVFPDKDELSWEKEEDLMRIAVPTINSRQHYFF